MVQLLIYHNIKTIYFLSQQSNFVWEMIFSRISLIQTARILKMLICMMMLKIVSKLHNSHVLKTTPAQYRTRRPYESTGVVAKDPPKVKLENFSQL